MHGAASQPIVQPWLNQKQVWPVAQGSVPFVHQQPQTPIDSVQPGLLSGLGKGCAAEPSQPSTALRGRGIMTTECASAASIDDDDATARAKILRAIVIMVVTSWLLSDLQLQI